MTSELKEISASVVQGSAIRPASYVVNTSELKVVHASNVLCKYADDTYIIIPSCNVDTRMVELDNVEIWAKGNNLTLNRAKCAEMVIHDSRRKCHVVMPHLLPAVARVQSMKVLGVTINCNLSVLDDVNDIIRSSAQTIHALRSSEHMAYCRTITPHGVPNSRRSQVDVRCKCLVELCLCC